MNTVYRVAKVDGERVILTPAEEAASCQTCGAQCASCDVHVEAVNPKKLPLAIGDEVIVVLSAKAESIRAIFSLAFPVTLAVAGFFLSKPVSLFFFKTEANENFSALCAFLFAVAGGALTLLFSKLHRTSERFEIEKRADS